MSVGGYIYVLTDAERMDNDEYMVGSYRPNTTDKSYLSEMRAYDKFLSEMREYIPKVKILYFYLCDNVQGVLDAIASSHGIMWLPDPTGVSEWIRMEHVSDIIYEITLEIVKQGKNSTEC